jgi:Skp family chaperone for outer membrane proteins
MACFGWQHHSGKNKGKFINSPGPLSRRDRQRSFALSPNNSDLGRAAARKDKMKTEFRQDVEPMTPAQVEAFRLTNTLVPSQAEQDRTEAYRDAMKARLQDAWKGPK